MKARSVARLANGCKLQTHRADVQPDVDAHRSRCQVYGARKCKKRYQMSEASRVQNDQEDAGRLNPDTCVFNSGQNTLKMTATDWLGQFRFRGASGGSESDFLADKEGSGVRSMTTLCPE